MCSAGRLRSMIFDIGGRQTALAIGPKPERVDGRTSQKPCREGGGTRGREIPKGPRHVLRSRASSEGGHVRNLAYLALSENDQFSQVKSRVCEMRYVAIHVACLIFVFFTGRLVVPHSKHGLTGTPRLFSRRRGEPYGSGVGRNKRASEYV